MRLGPYLLVYCIPTRSVEDIAKYFDIGAGVLRGSRSGWDMSIKVIYLEGMERLVKQNLYLQKTLG